MTIQPTPAPAPKSNGEQARKRLQSAWSAVSRQLRSPYFWRVQALVGMIAVPFYVVEKLDHGSSDNHGLYLLIPLLYALPIFFSGLIFRYKGARLTASIACLLVLPSFGAFAFDLNLGHIAEAAEVSISLVVGFVVARLLEHEATERRRVEDLSSQLAESHNRMNQVREEERRRIARDLHDVTAQSIVLLCREMDSIAAINGLPKAAVPPLHDMRLRADQILADIRRLSHDLRPSILDDLGLVVAVQSHASEIARRRGLEVQVLVEGADTQLRPETKLEVYRIVQEMLHNVARHADASQAKIDLHFARDHFRVSVRDNGKGFLPPDPSSAPSAYGKLGLVGIRERAHLIGATFLVKSELGKGTTCTLEAKY